MVKNTMTEDNRYNKHSIDDSSHPRYIYDILRLKFDSIRYEINKRNMSHSVMNSDSRAELHMSAISEDQNMIDQYNGHGNLSFLKNFILSRQSCKSYEHSFFNVYI